MPYITQDCMEDFIEGLKEAGHLSNANIESVIGAMKYYFGYNGK